MERLTRYLQRTERHPSGCLMWTGAKRGPKRAYGHVQRDGKHLSAQRAIWEEVHGPLDEELELDHATTCVSTLCVEPDHMTPVTHRQNLLNSTNFVAIKAAQTHCVHGHSLADAYRSTRGTRVCRPCAIERDRRRRALVQGASVA